MTESGLSEQLFEDFDSLSEDQKYELQQLMGLEDDV